MIFSARRNARVRVIPFQAGASLSPLRQGEHMTIQKKDLGAAVLANRIRCARPIVARAQELKKQGKKIITATSAIRSRLARPLTWLPPASCPLRVSRFNGYPSSRLPADAVRNRSAISREAGTEWVPTARAKACASSARRWPNLSRAAASAPIRRPSSHDGASKGVQTILKLLLASPTDGIMIPIPSTRSIAPPSRFTKGASFPTPRRG